MSVGEQSSVDECDHRSLPTGRQAFSSAADNEQSADCEAEIPAPSIAKGIRTGRNELENFQQEIFAANVDKCKEYEPAYLPISRQAGRQAFGAAADKEFVIRQLAENKRRGNLCIDNAKV